MKTYQKPEVDILDIMTEEMIAGSTPITEQGGNLNDAPITTATENNLSRQNDMWDTYEEPEY